MAMSLSLVSLVPSTVLVSSTTIVPVAIVSVSCIMHRDTLSITLQDHSEKPMEESYVPDGGGPKHDWDFNQITEM